MSEKLTIEEIKAMAAEEKAKLTKADYAHLNSMDKSVAKILIDEAKKGDKQTAREELVGTPEVSLADIKKAIKAEQKRKVKPKKFEDEHSKLTFWIRDDLREMINEAIIGEGKGAQTRLLNTAIEEYFKKLYSDIQKRPQ
ncbi:hypothetical protein [Priestia megaterium]|uniref:hypothetical protein n=1 Tax=Priestia megaterium TaxID=1404 RepID=UPI001DF60DBC|nr:hypothetical protein [Priestia megaterium]CAH0305707.1 hypothetical protein SRABI82_04720 [Priestia megaterium]